MNSLASDVALDEHVSRDVAELRDIPFDAVPAADAASTAQRSSTLDRLLCADLYFWGAWSGVAALLRLAGAPYQAADPAVRYDRAAIAFHAAQSLLVSLLFIAAELAIALGPINDRIAARDPSVSDWWGWVLLGIVLFKLVVINQLLPRWAFRAKHRAPGTCGHIALIAPCAAALARRLMPKPLRYEVGGQLGRVTYFAGDRPFVGYGTELNAWTVVIDTSASAAGLHELAGVAKEPEPLGVGDLYQAVIDGVEALGIRSLERGGSLFVDGAAADEEKRASGGKFRRPPARIWHERVREVDAEGIHGRWYMSLQMHQPAQDVVVTMFMRFAQEGKLIFCEFASYLLAPGLPRLYRMDRLFRINFLVYLAYAVLVSAVLAVIAYADYGLTAFGLLTLAGGEIQDWWARAFAPLLTAGSVAFASGVGDPAAFIFLSIGNPLVYAYALVANAVVLVASVLVYWLLRQLVGVIALALDLTGQFGLTFSYRERFASRAALKYYAMQEVVRFLKMQEKILIRSILHLLRQRGIDGSDFKDSLTAYINQGVINSGDIRGNVVSSIKSFVYRRPARSANHRMEAGRRNG